VKPEYGVVLPSREVQRWQCVRLPQTPPLASQRRPPRPRNLTENSKQKIFSKVAHVTVEGTMSVTPFLPCSPLGSTELMGWPGKSPGCRPVDNQDHPAGSPGRNTGPLQRRGSKATRAVALAGQPARETGMTDHAWTLEGIEP
jgi:hypothetical protein